MLEFSSRPECGAGLVRVETSTRWRQCLVAVAYLWYVKRGGTLGIEELTPDALDIGYSQSQSGLSELGVNCGLGGY